MKKATFFITASFSVFGLFLDLHHIANLEARSRADFGDGHLLINLSDQQLPFHGAPGTPQKHLGLGIDKFPFPEFGRSEYHPVSIPHPSRS